MAVEITMPQLSDTMSEGKIISWLKKEGDAVKRGDALAEVATDKADLEIESFHEGTLLKITSPVGTVVEVGTVIAVIGEKGESVGSAKPAMPTSKESPVAAPAKQEPAPVVKAPETARPPQMSSEAESPSDRVKISPLARNVAASHGIDYSHVKGSGEGGRIIKRDIEQQFGNNVPKSDGIASTATLQVSAPIATKQVPTPPSPQHLASKTEQLSSMRQTIAARMVESVTTAPHFYVTSRILMDAVVKLKNTLKPLQQYEGITYNHLIIRAVALALQKVPSINASYQNGSIVQPGTINIGIVTSVSGGLLVPVLKNANNLALADIVAEARALVQRARTGRPKSEDLMGGTFSISNMGMFAVESFTAIINPGQGAILAISGIEEEPVVIDGEIRVGSVMRATLSLDHRIIDGVIAGEFLTELKRIMEDPVLLLA